MLMIGICQVNPRSKVLKGSGVHVKLVFTEFPQFGSGAESRIVVFRKATKRAYALVMHLSQWRRVKRLLTVGIDDSRTLLLTLKEPSARAHPPSRSNCNPPQALSGTSVAFPMLQSVSRCRLGKIPPQHKPFSQLAITREAVDIVWSIFPVLGLKVTIHRRASAIPSKHHRRLGTDTAS